jgi:Gas vesicle protein G
MGLITGLLTLPLAPVRGTMWIAERIEQQAEAELYDESAIRTGLLELEQLRAAGDVDDEEVSEAEDALVERLFAIRGGGAVKGRDGPIQ